MIHVFYQNNKNNNKMVMQTSPKKLLFATMELTITELYEYSYSILTSLKYGLHGLQKNCKLKKKVFNLSGVPHSHDDTCLAITQQFWFADVSAQVSEHLKGALLPLLNVRWLNYLLFVLAITGWVGGTAMTHTMNGDVVPGTTAVERVS